MTSGGKNVQKKIAVMDGVSGMGIRERAAVAGMPAGCSC